MPTLKIKNMVCPRCIMAVKDVLTAIGLTVGNVTLGEADIKETPTAAQRKQIQAQLTALGFELLEDPLAALVEKVRTLVIEWVRLRGERPKLSAYIQGHCLKDYSMLSRLFSETRGVTIEKYCAMQRVEMVKELLCYSEKTVSEIANEMGYSSLAHLSTQFKQFTGMSPKEFQKMSSHTDAAQRTPIDRV